MTFYLFTGLAEVYLTTPTTGVVNANNLASWIYDEDAIDPEYDALSEAYPTGDDGDDSAFQAALMDYSPSTLLLGDWKQDDNGQYDADPELPKHGFAAIFNLEEHTVQVILSKWITRGKPCSLCYPNQVDLDETGPYMGYDLPAEYYERRENANAVELYVPVEDGDDNA